MARSLGKIIFVCQNSFASRLRRSKQSSSLDWWKFSSFCFASVMGKPLKTTQFLTNELNRIGMKTVEAKNTARIVFATISIKFKSSSTYSNQICKLEQKKERQEWSRRARVVCKKNAHQELSLTSDACAPHPDGWRASAISNESREQWQFISNSFSQTSERHTRLKLKIIVVRAKCFQDILPSVEGSTKAEEGKNAKSSREEWKVLRNLFLIIATFQTSFIHEMM